MHYDPPVSEDSVADTAFVRVVRVLGATLVAACMAGAVVDGQQSTGKPPAAAPDTSKPATNTDSTKVPGAREPATLEARLDRQRAATERALFASDDPLPVTLIADFKAVNRDRDPESTRTFPGTIVVPGRLGGEDRIDVQLRTRGHSRRMSATCTFAPIRLVFTGKTAGTVFAGHKALKLGTHCRDVESYEQYVYREYAVYKIFNRITPRSFRARLAAATYVDVASQKPLTSRAGLFIEDDDDVAKRLDGQITELEGMTFAHVDAEAMALVGLFEYMIGNTDMSLLKLHNIKVVRAASGTAYPIPYDFDYSGVVNARYAVPSKPLGLGTVRERLYRGPCLTQEKLTPLLTRLTALHDDMLAVYDHVPSLDPGYSKDARGYLEQFFKTIQKPADAKRAFIDGCDKRPTM